MSFKAGYINIIGKPNAGKSTLMNQLVGEKLSIVTSKAQTTRHRILGIVNTSSAQMIFSDTPGFIADPAYPLQQTMQNAVLQSLEDADVILLLIDATAPALDAQLITLLKKNSTPVIVGINKVDTLQEADVKKIKNHWASVLPDAAQFPLVANQGFGVGELFGALQDLLPASPPYFPPDQLTDRPERFFAAEIIREQILQHYRQEVPYSVEVVVESFKETGKMTRIEALLYVNRKSQKPILIGKGGAAIKRLGIAARMALEAWLQAKVHLELHVKVREKWREDEQQLKRFGYD